MKVLVLSQTPWRNDNSFGSSYSSIFGGMDDIEFANIYCRAGLPQNNICHHHFYISESALVKNLINKKVPTGRVIETVQSEQSVSQEPKAYKSARVLRWQIFYWAQAMFWAVSRWKSQALIDFIDDFDADILFFPIYYSEYTNRVAKFITEHTKKKLIIYISDDIYTLRQFSLSPFYWIRRFMLRPRVKNMIKRCELLYVISDVQKKSYERIFGKETKVLTKGADFSNKPKNKAQQGVVRMLYTGNIGSGRWRVLAEIAKSLKALNAEKQKVILDIYTLTPITKKMKAALDVAGSAKLHGGVSSAQVKKLQAQADVLVHVESFSFKERLKVYQSFSTKLVDYMHMGKCIFAAGPEEVASIQHLIQNDAAIIATGKNEIPEKLSILVEQPDQIAEYASKAWACGKKHHEITTIQTMIRNDMNKVLAK
ncbi:MAG: hypothetical protein AB1Z19_04245 [Eubacteriales bacterium]